LTIGTDVISEGLVEMLDGQFETAEQVLREGYDWLRQRGAHTALAILAVMLARVHLRLGNDNQAQRFIEEAREVAVETQFDAQIKWRSLQALVEARQGDYEIAHRLAVEVSTLAEQSGQPDTQAEALLDLAEVLLLASRREESVEAARKALGIYDQRGSANLVRKVERLLASLSAHPEP
jgi:ATP/maltotriose-dependent transcriptional regulator MalT